MYNYGAVYLDMHSVLSFFGRLCARACVQPTDLVKVRFQSEGVLQPGQRPRYSGVFNAYATIVREEGLRGLWTGVGPNIIRNSIINAAELVSYDSAKEVG